ncbi:hypothetical protein [Lapidilactobacillus luobeiensis]|uniref:hypothetical protein n=1 Tax=Lapidilactobacillus luobeiensis TaxID=2950371 RepID=UPI0021C25853|nr:hypothetical protein [Lapidilactobacillus luobeiensis]
MIDGNPTWKNEPSNGKVFGLYTSAVMTTNGKTIAANTLLAKATTKAGSAEFETKLLPNCLRFFGG